MPTTSRSPARAAPSCAAYGPRCRREYIGELFRAAVHRHVATRQLEGQSCPVARAPRAEPTGRRAACGLGYYKARVFLVIGLVGAKRPSASLDRKSTRLNS